MQRQRVVRVLVYEGDPRWIEATLNNNTVKSQWSCPNGAITELLSVEEPRDVRSIAELQADRDLRKRRGTQVTRGPSGDTPAQAEEAVSAVLGFPSGGRKE